MPAAAASSRPARVTVTDGFTISGPAGAQAVIRLGREVGPPGVLQQGPPVTLTASTGDFAGLAFVGARYYDTVVRAMPRYVCGRSSCGPDAYDTDADTNVRQGARLPRGEYLVVLLGAPGARVTATVASSSRSVRPVRVTPTAQPRIEAGPTIDIGGYGPDLEQQETGSWTKVQNHRRALAGVVHVAELQYGGSVGFSLSCPGHARSGTVSLKNSEPGPVPLGWAWTPMYTTQVAFGESDQVEATLTPTWSGRVEAARARQRGLGVYVPLVAV
jgi:hypothetical protein